MLAASKAYYEKVEDYDSLAWADLLLCKKLKKANANSVLGKRLFCDISTTGLPQEDVYI